MAGQTRLIYYTMINGYKLILLVLKGKVALVNTVLLLTL